MDHRPLKVPLKPPSSSRIYQSQPPEPPSYHSPSMWGVRNQCHWRRTTDPKTPKAISSPSSTEFEMERWSRDVSFHLCCCCSNWRPRKGPDYELLQENLRSIHHIGLATVAKAIDTMKQARDKEEVEKGSQRAGLPDPHGVNAMSYTLEGAIDLMQRLTPPNIDWTTDEDISRIFLNNSELAEIADSGVTSPNPTVFQRTGRSHLWPSNICSPGVRSNASVVTALSLLSGCLCGCVSGRKAG